MKIKNVLLSISVISAISGNVYAEQFCNEYGNNRMTCYSYDNRGKYEGQTDYQRNGRSNSFSGHSTDAKGNSK